MYKLKFDLVFGWNRKVDESLRAEDVEIYYDPADLISKLLKGELISQEENVADAPLANTGNCPFEKQVWSIEICSFNLDLLMPVIF